MSAAAPSAARAVSDALHARVRAFGRSSVSAPERAPADSFERLAFDIARYQFEHGSVLRRLAPGSAGHFARLSAIPAVPADAFRLGRVAVHLPSEDVARFQTSGTTGGSGVHPFRSLETYRELSLAWGGCRLLGGACGFGFSAPLPKVTVLGLAAPYEPECRSSLGFMMQEFMRNLDGRALTNDGPFDALEPGRWLLGPGALDLAALGRGAALALQRGEPLLLLATSFALSWLLDALAGERLPLPPGSVVMQTGGFKSHARSLDDRELAAALCRALGVPAQRLIGEYGMTELGSQLYDTGFACGHDGASVFVEPPWLRVTPVDPVTLAEVPPGELGLARFTDLCNVDSALVVLTQDQVRRVPGGILLCGRRLGARLRGCSLAAEALALAEPSAGDEAPP